jgi:hypothetical protein
LTGEVSARARAVLQGSGALTRRDYEVIGELMDLDFEFVSAISAALLGERARTNAYRGGEGLRQFMQEIEESFPDLLGLEADIHEVSVYLDRDEALRAAGLEND